LNEGSEDYPAPKSGQAPERPEAESADSTPEAGAGLSDSAPEVPELAPPPPVEDQPVSHAIPAAAAQQIEHLRKRLDEKDAQISQVMDAYRKLKKDSERARQRIEQNQQRVFAKSKTEFISRFIEVLDNIDRAITAVENNFDSDSVLQGIILLRSRLVQLLREEGLEKIFVEGQPFDPTHSEAAAIEPVDNQAEDNFVLRELQRGYKMKGALLRPARVVVGRFQGSRAGEHEEPNPPSAGGGDSSENS
jgi:molecular chaperone GrpE